MKLIQPFELDTTVSLLLTPAETLGLILELGSETLALVARHGHSVEQLTRLHDVLTQAFGVRISREEVTPTEP